jgi:hypothetical protein
MVVGCVLLAAAAAVVYFGWGYIQAFIDGPHKVGLSALDAARDTSDLPGMYVRFQAGKVQKTKLVRQVTKYGVASTEAVYLIVHTGNKVLLVEAPPKESGPLFSGLVADWDKGIDLEARQKLEAKFPEIRGKVLPFGLSAGRSTQDGIWIVMLPAGLLGILGLFFVCATPPGQQQEEAEQLKGLENAVR